MRCPDLWRSQSSVPEEQQYHTWLAMITTMDFVRKLYFSLPFKQQYYNTLASFMSITTLSLLWPSLVPVLIQHPLSHYSQENHNQDEDGTWRRSTVAYKRGSFVISRKPVLHCEMATKEGTSKRARMAKMISLF